MMATAKITREQAARGEGCLGRAADDEPVFVLRAQDALAPEIVETWAFRLEHETLGRDSPSTRKRSLSQISKIRGARALAREMRAWQASHDSKLPD